MGRAYVPLHGLAVRAFSSLSMPTVSMQSVAKTAQSSKRLIMVLSSDNNPTLAPATACTERGTSPAPPLTDLQKQPLGTSLLLSQPAMRCTDTASAAQQHWQPQQQQHVLLLLLLQGAARGPLCAPHVPPKPQMVQQ